jgi:RNA polymerase sigma-70 factor, ECF subfamily
VRPNTRRADSGLAGLQTRRAGSAGVENVVSQPVRLIISPVNNQLKTTEEFIIDLKQGRNSEDSFRVVFERHYAQVYRFLRRKGLEPDDCRDLSQEIFLSVYKKLGDLRQESQFESWLYKIALNAYRSRIEQRFAKKRAANLVPLEQEVRGTDGFYTVGARTIDPRANPMEATLEKERLEMLREALHQLPEQMRRCTQLRVLNELSYQEIASVMDISINTVKAHLHQAQKVLREKLRPYFGEVQT